MQECELCMTAHVNERWICMRNCDCQFHATCIEIWRADAHNLCPTCEAPISTVLFYTAYVVLAGHVF